MRYYIILQPTIRSMGGEEMYTRNKVNSARERGYTPLVFHNGGGEKIYVDELKVYEKYEFQEFRYEPCVISKGKKKRLLERIKSILEDYDEESIIESHEMLIAEWGEFVAKALGIRHFAYMLLEHNTITYKPLYDFFKFKYNRRELAGIIRNTIPDMFCEFTNDVEGYSLPAYCPNVYENIPCPDKFKIVNGYCTIGSIGRTNKAYVQPMIDAVLKFVGRLMVPTVPYKDLYFLERAKRFRKAVKMPLIYVGGVCSKENMDEVLNEGFIAFQMARTLVNDTDFMNKIKEGTITKSECKHSNYCIGRMYTLEMKCHHCVENLPCKLQKEIDKLEAANQLTN